jgi:hypothetical protein
LNPCRLMPQVFVIFEQVKHAVPILSHRTNDG